MIRSVSRALVLTVLLIAFTAPAVHASRPGLPLPQESASSWLDTALSWLGDLLWRKSPPAVPARQIEVTNTTGSCIDPQGKPITCGG